MSAGAALQNRRVLLGGLLLSPLVSCVKPVQASTLGESDTIQSSRAVDASQVLGTCRICYMSTVQDLLLTTNYMVRSMLASSAPTSACIFPCLTPVSLAQHLL